MILLHHLFPSSFKFFLSPFLFLLTLSLLEFYFTYINFLSLRCYSFKFIFKPLSLIIVLYFPFSFIANLTILSSFLLQALFSLPFLRINPYFPYRFYLFLYLCLLPLLFLIYRLVSPNDFLFLFVNFSFLCVSLISLIPSSLFCFYFSIILFFSSSSSFLITLFSSFPLTLVLTLHFTYQTLVHFFSKFLSRFASPLT